MDPVKQNLKIINQVFEIEKKLAQRPEGESIRRNIARIKEYFLEMGYHIHNPQGEKYDETRTDCEASIAGTSAENLYIEEVIKPRVILRQEGSGTIAQKAVVIAHTR